MYVPNEYHQVEVDNASFAFGLSDRARATVEDKGRVDLNDAESKLLDRTKHVHVVLIVLFLLMGIALQGSLSVIVSMTGNVLGLFPVLLGAWAEACGPGEPVQGKGTRGVAVVTVRYGLGFVAAFLIFRNIAKMRFFGEVSYM